MEGTPFGRYVLVEPVGRGGMGEVWRAFDTVTERVVAIKVLPANFADDQTYQTRFRREAKAAAGLNDPHVVPIHDFGEIHGRLYVTMRLVEGEDLQTIIDRGPLRPDRAVRIVEQIAGALHAAHRIDLVHRDVKPHNILLTEDDFAYLIDFGIARAAGETSLTSAGSTIGTWAYMAPERFQTGAADARADIYALTVVLFQMLTGQLPFPAVSIEQVAMAHMTQPPPPLSLVRNDIPPAMDSVIATGMAKNPAHRYATTKDLAAAAHSALFTSGAPPFRPAAPPPPQPITRMAPNPRHPAPHTWQSPAVPGMPAPLAAASPGGNKKVIALTSVCAALLLAVVAVVVYGTAIRGGDATNDSGPSTNADGSSSGGATTTKPLVDTTVADGPTTFSVASVETRRTVTSITNPSEQTTASGEFFVVYLSVGNTEDQPWTFLEILQKLKVGAKVYEPDFAATNYLNGPPKMVDPGAQVEFAVAFDVPVGTVPTAIEVSGIGGSGKGVELPL